jgi:hypothetical protein
MKKILTIAVIGVLCYGGYIFAKPYVNSHFLQKQMQWMADKADLKTDREIVEELVAFANERGLPLERRDFKVKRYDGRTYISVNYSQDVEVPLLSKHYQFDLKVVS